MYHDEDDWILVDYGRGRRRRRGADHQHPAPGNPSRPPRSNYYAPGARRTYASVAQHGRRDHRNDSAARPQQTYASVTRYGRRDRGYDFRGQRPTSFWSDRPPRTFWTAERRDNGRTEFGRYRERQPQRSQPADARPRYGGQRFQPGFNGDGRRGGQRQYRQINNNRSRYENIRPVDREQSDDPNFTIKVRILHKIIKATHHLKNASNANPPPNIEKMTQNLATFIKPASPSPQTNLLLEGNARNWSHTTMIILQEHYVRNREEEIDQLSKLPEHGWRAPLDVASSWAKRNLGNRLQDATLRQVEAILSARLPDQQPAAQRADIQPQQTGRTEGRTGTTLVQIHAPQPADVPVASRTTGTMTQQRGGDWSPFTEQDTAAAPDPPRAPLPPPPPSATPREQREVRSVPISAPPTADHLPAAVTSQPLSSSPPPPTPPPPVLTPAVSIRRTRSTNPFVQFEEDVISVLPSQEEVRAATPASSVASSSSRYDLRTLNLGPLRRGQRTTQPPTSTPHENTQAASGSQQDSQNAFSVLMSRASPPTTPTRRPTRHLNTNRKMVDWSLSARKKWVVIGDSNVARFPPFQIADLQMDSYPGAGFRHAEAICRKATASASTTVEKIILSFGLNHRAQKIEGTAIQQLQRAVRAAKSRFPQAQVLVPEINFSPALPLKERMTLQALNKHITAHYDFIPRLPQAAFKTESDRVHWTRETAAAMLAHWSVQVN